MRKTFRHAGLLMMVGVIALGLLGAAYTLWYEDLSVTANVDTAQFDVDWSCQTGIDTDTSAAQDCAAASVDTVAVLASALTPGTNPALAYSDFDDQGNGGSPDAKYIQTCTAAITDDAPASNDAAGDDNVLTLTLDNLYPFAGCKFSIDIDMPNGTDYVPAHLTLTSVAKDGALKLLVAGNEAAACNDLVSKLDSETEGIIESAANTAFQIHANEHLYCTFIVYLQEYDPDSADATVEENGEYSLTATVTAHQWNEVVN